ncbi:MAG: glycosyltransferase WbuB [Candidatus Latescibacterota bacterium]|nr:MAG: glycosyltransferase WbuB [Candidatus Latescibacterota bacterium]
MKILFITQYFHPEVGAASARITDLAKELASLGHCVTVVAEFPNYPTGKLAKEYRWRLHRWEKLGPLHILRTFVIVSKRRNFFQRMALYISFMCSSILGGLFVPRFDVVIATSPPLFVGLCGYVVGRLRGAKFVFDVRDLWPESAVVLGELKNRWARRLAERLERMLYRKADRITVVVPGFRSKIEARSGQKNKIEEITNGVDAEVFVPDVRADLHRKRWNLEDKFVVLFSGNHGLAQGLFSVMEAAESLRDYRDIVFLFVGEGVEKEALLRRKWERSLDRTIFLEAQPHSRMPSIISMSDVCLVPLKKNDLFRNALPSKMFEYMVCGRPIILSIRGEAEILIREAKAGIPVEPENAGEIAGAVLKLYTEKSLRRTLGGNGREYVVQKFSRKQIAQKLEGLLTGLCGRRESDL